jgi:hypothetical protein
VNGTERRRLFVWRDGVTIAVGLALAWLLAERHDFSSGWLGFACVVTAAFAAAAGYRVYRSRS